MIRVVVPYESMKVSYPKLVECALDRVQNGKSAEKHEDPSNFRWSYLWSINGEPEPIDAEEAALNERSRQREERIARTMRLLMKAQTACILQVFIECSLRRMRIRVAITQSRIPWTVEHYYLTLFNRQLEVM